MAILKPQSKFVTMLFVLICLSSCSHKLRVVLLLIIAIIVSIILSSISCPIAQCIVWYGVVRFLLECIGSFFLQSMFLLLLYY